MVAGQMWYEYLDEPMKELVDLSYLLVEREEKSSEALDAYDFLVFPMAKAYEGFLKKYLLDMGLISEVAYRSKHFRLGRSLNPKLPREWRDNRWLYDDLERRCPGEIFEGKTVAYLVWEAWKKGRNEVFHYFPSVQHKSSFEDAKMRMELMRRAMESALVCKRGLGV